MRVLRVIAVISLVTLLQIALVAKWRIFGVHPEFTYCLPIAAGLLGGAQSGALVGFASGFAIDLYLPTPFGLTALVATLMGGLVGLLIDRERVAVDASVPILGSIFAASFSFLALLSFALISAIIGTTPLSGISWLPLLLVVPFFNALAMLAIQPLMAWSLAIETRASAPW